MDREDLGRLFISYSHLDQPYMQIFRKHLRGMLMDRVLVWSDQEITKGEDWLSSIKGNQVQANSALILASPDYLVSPWCRHELREFASARSNGRLRNLFWIQLKPCGWQHTELAKFQSSDLGSQAISEAGTDNQRDRAILQACEQIASGVIQSVTKEDQQLAMIRRLLAGRDGLTVNDVAAEGAFSIVCRGSQGGEDVVVKMFLHAPLKQVTEEFCRIGKARRTVRDPVFVRIRDVFEVYTPEGTRTFMISDHLSRDDRFSKSLETGKTIPVDDAAEILRRLAVAVAALHNAGDAHNLASETEWEWTLGFLMPKDVYLEPNSVRVRIAPLGVSSFLWHVLDWERFVKWVHSGHDAVAYQLPEQFDRPAMRATRKTDQYVLARLGLELLEGRSLPQMLKGHSLEEFWSDPECIVKGDWKDNHRQLWSILKKMLNRDPAARWSSMDEVVSKLSRLEEYSRALAKRAYSRQAVESEDALHLRDPKFFETFYRLFFAKSEKSKSKFSNPEQQHLKLMDAMTAVLNFHDGNSPTSLDKYLEAHKAKHIEADEFDAFKDCFLETLRLAGADDKVVGAWRDLFKPVVEYMGAHCIGDAPAPGVQAIEANPNPMSQTMRRSRGATGRTSKRIGGREKI